MSTSTPVDLVRFGASVKALGDGKVGGYLVLFGDEDNTDIEGDFFTKSTDFDLDRGTKCSVYYAHGQDPAIKTARLGLEPFEMKVDDVGVWVEGQLNLRKKYEKAIYALAEKGALGWSSGTAAHLVERKDVGDAFEILKWPLGDDASLTPTPCESRTQALPIKSLKLPSLHEILAIKSTGPSQSDRIRLLSDALTVKLRAEAKDSEYRSWWAYLVDVFDATLVYVLDDGDGDTDYFEAPYSFDGLIPTIGEGTPVVRTTKYEPVGQDEPAETGLKTISGALKGLSSLRFADHSDSVRTAVKEYRERARDYAQIREDRGKRLTQERADEFKAIKTALTETVAAIDEVLALAPEPPAETKAADPERLRSLRIERLKLDPAHW